MTIATEDAQQYIDIGTYEIWQALRSTIAVHVPKSREIRPALDFLESGSCNAKKGLETARALNLIRDALSAVKPNQLVFDSSDLSKKAPWAGDISPVITSCANYLTTADGKDLLAELVGILTYAFYMNTDIEIQ